MTAWNTNPELLASGTPLARAASRFLRATQDYDSACTEEPGCRDARYGTQAVNLLHGEVFPSAQELCEAVRDADARTALSDLQDRAASWHAARFPQCTAEDVTLKAVAELGEVADAVLAEGRDAAHPERAGQVLAESADVLVTLFALCGRFGHGDLLAAVDAKLSLLETPGGPHPGLSTPSENGGGPEREDSDDD